MTKVEKNLSKIPSLLQKYNRKESFEKNILSKEFCDEKNRYKGKTVLDSLKEIYKTKCAYCEKNLIDTPKHIEHYRPKKTYYWLAYSWDNLLLCCTSCNSSKGERFKIKNIRASYNNEKFENIHNLRDSYDNEEQPYLINPEKDDIFDELIYSKNAIISSNNKRVAYTIDSACKLNRKELVQKREIIISDFINLFNEQFLTFIKIEHNIQIFEAIISSFLKKCNTHEEFYSFRKFIMENIEIFFEEKLKQMILKKIFTKLQTRI